MAGQGAAWHGRHGKAPLSFQRGFFVGWSVPCRERMIALALPVESAPQQSPLGGRKRRFSMSKYKGFFELKKPENLFRKLKRDFERMKSEPLSSDAAFDFFVTAHHMLDWVFPDDKPSQVAKENSELLLQVCSHLANGSKHFEATAKKHQSVKDTEQHAGAFSSDFSSDFDIDRFDCAS
jgi:hypothetical protein